MVVIKHAQNIPRQVCGSALWKPAARRFGFQVQDLQIAYRFNASTVYRFNHAMRSSIVSGNLLIFVALATALCAASGQTAPADRFREPLEKPGMPPAPLGTYRLESSPGMISQFGVFTSYQVNVDANGNNIVGDAANEPSISVDPTDGNKIAIGWRQFDTITSNFRQAGYGYSTD